MADSLDQLAQRLQAFAQARDWGQFHSPKNLDHFQWLTEDQSRHLDAGKKQEVAFEMADVLLYLIQMGNELGVDLIDAAQRKVALNEQKYPVEQAKGSSKKYDEL